jgi:hypothetical protein
MGTHRGSLTLARSVLEFAATLRKKKALQA